MGSYVLTPDFPSDCFVSHQHARAQGTVAMEMLEQCAFLDAVVVRDAQLSLTCCCKSIKKVVAKQIAVALFLFAFFSNSALF